MEKSGMVTVIVLSYNKFDYLYEAIESALNQSYEKIEIIIQDDASVSFPKKQIVSFIEKNKGKNLVRFLVESNEKNLGTVKNFNCAIKKGTGDYFITLSGDDVFYDENTIQKIVNRFRESGEKMLCCRRLLCTEKDLIPIRYMPNSLYIPLIKKINTPFKQYLAFGKGNYYEMASGSVTYFSRDFFDMYGYFDENYVYWEDGPLYARHTRLGNIIPTAYDITAIKYRKGGVSTGGDLPIRFKDDYIKFYEREFLPYMGKIKLKRRDMRKMKFRMKRVLSYRNMSYKEKAFFIIQYLDCIIEKKILSFLMKLANYIETLCLRYTFNGKKC
ncbi:MAG: glycosyltransferase [Dethiosulfatibacter sp.]|nr:glycosyltransferase [Dethiosulfatibacter sp.]